MSLSTHPRTDTAPSPSQSRLSLAALCEPTPLLPAMSDALTSAGPSSPRQDVPNDGRTGQKPLSLSEQDESVMIAVRALDDMRSRPVPSSSSFSSYQFSTPPQATPALTAASTAASPSTESQILSLDDDASADFVSRVSGLPIVNTALRAYEHSKARSRVVKYGAEMMESSVKTISKPVIDRLPVNQLDEFACRQLDRLGKYKPGARTDAPDRSASSEREIPRQSWERCSRDEDIDRSQSLTPLDTGNQTEAMPRETVVGHERDDQAQIQEVANRSRWHNILYEAGGIGVAVSEESMRRLRYCLQWLQYATGHIDGQILILRNFIGSLNEREDADGGEERPISASHMQTLTNVKRDVVGTIRQVVDVVSKYAGGALPEPARMRVRQFILHLPQRWATNAHRQTHAPVPAHAPGQPKSVGKRRRRDGISDPGSAASTAPPSPIQSPVMHGNLPLPAVASGSSHRTARPTAGSAAQAAQRVLTLATESLDMMRSVTGVFKESLDRADTWVERLRIVGIQRQQSSDAAPGELHPSDGSNESDSLASATSTYTSFPPSPRSWATDVPSPGGLAASSLDALSLSSSFVTPRSSTSSLPALAGYDWEYTTRKLQTMKDESLAGEGKTIERSAVSALRGTAMDPPGSSMEED